MTKPSTIGRARVFALAWLGLCVCCAVAGDPAEQATVQSVSLPEQQPGDKPTVQEYRVLQQRPDRLVVELPNRMIVIAAEVHSAPVVSAQVWVKTGSIYEQEHVGAGLSHFLEHLLAGGNTTHRTEDQTNEILSAIGAETNASTSLDTVRYYINTTTPYADQAIGLLSDWMLNSQITPQEYDRERSVIQREFEMGQGEPDRIFWKLTQQARYASHPARHPTIGYLDQFLAVTRDEIYDFYKRMYVPNNMVFVVAGDIDRRAVVRQIAELWGGQPVGPLPQLRLPVEDQPSDHQPLSGVADIDKPRLRLAWAGTRLAGDGDYALDLLAMILGQGESSRLALTVRDQQRLVNAVTAYNISFPWGEGFFGIDAEIVVPDAKPESQATAQQQQQERLRAVSDAVLEQVERIGRDGVAPAELARAKRKTIASVVYNAQSAQAIANRLAEDLIGMKDPDYMHRYARAIQAVTAQEVQAAANRFLNPAKLINVSLIPPSPGQAVDELIRPEQPTEADVRTEAVSLDNEVILDRLRAGFGTDLQASAGVEAAPIKRFVMPNGLRVLVGRSTLVPAVAMQMYHVGGLLSDTPGREGLANAASAMRIKGTQTRSAQEISELIEDLGASLTAECSYNSSYTRAVCLKEDWEPVLGLLADVTLAPAFPEDEWEKLQPRLLAAIDRQADAWTGELQLSFRKAYFGDYPWSVTPLGRREVVASLAPDDLRAFHQGRLGAEQSVLVIIGDVDPGAVVARVERLFDKMPARAAQPFSPTQPTAPGERFLPITTSKPLVAVQIGFGPGVARTHPDYAGLQVLARVLSRFPSGWLEQELRGRGPGLVYAVGAGQFTGLVPGYFAILFNTQPDAVSEAVQRSMAVVRRAKETTVDDQTLAAAKAKVLAEEFLYKQTNSDRAADAALNELYGLGLDEPEHFRDRVQGIDAAQLQRLAQTYLQHPVAVVLHHQPIDEPSLKQNILP